MGQNVAFGRRDLAICTHYLPFIHNVFWQGIPNGEEVIVVQGSLSSLAAFPGRRAGERPAY
jgi:hypothetical protein